MDAIPQCLPVDPASPQARALIAASDAYMDGLYPPTSNHLEGVTALQRPGVHVAGISDGGALLAMGACKLCSDDGEYGEIKRVFVSPAARGRGLARHVMQHLERWLLGQRIALARLETGVRQPEALALYRRLGYRERGPFGGYAQDPLSVFMEKQLPAQAVGAAGDGAQVKGTESP